MVAAGDGHAVSCNKCDMLEISIEAGEFLCIYHGADICSLIAIVAS